MTNGERTLKFKRRRLIMERRIKEDMALMRRITLSSRRYSIWDGLVGIFQRWLKRKL
mgnify:CR=1 FL=1